MPEVKCPLCEFKTPDYSEALACTVLDTHAVWHKEQAALAAAAPATQATQAVFKQKPLRLDRPTIARGTSQEEWNTFTRKWNLFKNGTDIPPNQLTTQLWQCCDKQLEDDVFKDMSDISTATETDLLAVIKNLSVITVSTSVRQKELLSMKQDHGQPIRSYAAQLKGKAQTCSFSKVCPCGSNVDFTDDIVKIVVLNGLSSNDISQEVLGTPGIDDKSLNDTISLVENKEMAARAMRTNSTQDSSSSINAMNVSSRVPQEIQAKLSITTKCSNCEKQFKKFKLRKERGKFKLKEFSLCVECWRAKISNSTNSSITDHDNDALFDSISGITVTEDPDRTVNTRISMIVPVNKTAGSRRAKKRRKKKIKESTDNQDPTSAIGTSEADTFGTSEGDTSMERNSDGTVASVTLDHHIFDGTRGWVAAESKKQPTLELTFSIDEKDYEQMNLPTPVVTPSQVKAITDTGAQSSLMGLIIYLQLGLQLESLIPVTRKMHAANNEGINILGAILVRLSGADTNGDVIECGEMIYISDSTEQFYMSRHAMEQLRIIAPDFPKIGAVPLQVWVASNDGTSQQTGTAPCGCPLRQLPPERPTSLPFAAVEENTELMKNWLLERFASSTFNTCPHQTLPKMSGPPMRIHVDPDATPVAVRTPASTPIKWKDEVKEDIERDVRLGVIERVPPNTPTRWLHRAMWTRKPSGGLRRVVDMQAINKHSLRETHHTVPPFKQARIIPPNTIRTVTDASNGFHSVSVHEDDRDYL